MADAGGLQGSMKHLAQNLPAVRPRVSLKVSTEENVPHHVQNCLFKPRLGALQRPPHRPRSLPRVIAIVRWLQPELLSSRGSHSSASGNHEGMDE